MGASPNCKQLLLQLRSLVPSIRSCTGVDKSTCEHTCHSEYFCDQILRLFNRREVTLVAWRKGKLIHGSSGKMSAKIGRASRSSGVRHVK
jgi:hypothetical protein